MPDGNFQVETWQIKIMVGLQIYEYFHLKILKNGMFLYAGFPCARSNCSGFDYKE